MVEGWRRLLSVPWIARRSNQSILKEISPGCSLEGLMLKLKLQYFGHLMRRADSFEKTLMLGKTEGRRRGRQRMRWLDGIILPSPVLDRPSFADCPGLPPPTAVAPWRSGVPASFPSSLLVSCEGTEGKEKRSSKLCPNSN